MEFINRKIADAKTFVALDLGDRKVWFDAEELEAGDVIQFEFDGSEDMGNPFLAQITDEIEDDRSVDAIAKTSVYSIQRVALTPQH